MNFLCYHAFALHHLPAIFGPADFHHRFQGRIPIESVNYLASGCGQILFKKFEVFVEVFYAFS